MRHVASVIGCVLLVSCGPPGSVAPTDVKPEDLEGWWLSVEPELARVFGFVKPPDGPFSVPIDFAHREAFVSANYQGPASLGSMSPKAWSTYEVKEGKIVETVIDSVDFDPGTTFTTPISSLVKRDTLVLESSSGKRSYRWNEHCPVRNTAGWGRFQAINHESYFATAPALAFDSKGRLHSYVAMAGEQGNPPARPTYGVLDKGCEVVRFGMSNARASTMVVDASDVVHLVTTESAVYSEHPDSTLVHRWRQADSQTWSTAVIDATQSARALQLTTRGERLLLVSVQTSSSAPKRGQVELFERRGEAWMTRVVTVAGQTVTGATLRGAALDLDHRLLVATNAALLRETPGADFEALPLATGTNLTPLGDLFVDGAGRAHLLYASPAGSVHGVFDGSTWELTPLPQAEQLVASQQPPWVFTAKTRHAFPYFVVGTQGADGTVRYELSSGAHFNPGTHTSSAAAVAANGTIAVAPTGEQVQLERSGAPAPELVAVQLNLGGTGSGRVSSQDGAIDCTSSCTLMLPVFSRYRLRTEPAAGSALAKQGGEPDTFPTEYTWLTVWPTDSAELSMTQGQNVLSIEFDKNVVRQVIPLEAETAGSAAPGLLDVHAGQIAVSYTSSNGTVFFRDTTYTAAGSGAGQVLLLSNGAPVVRRIPATPRALAVLAGGGAQATFFATAATAFEGMTWGSSTAPAVVRMTWDAALTPGTPELLATFPAQTSFVASKTHANGAAAVLVRNANGFPALGANVFAALVWRNASGQVRTAGLPSLGASGVALELDGTHAAVRDDATMHFFEDGQLTQTRTLVRARFDAFAFGAGGLLAFAVAVGDGADFGGGPLTTSGADQEYLARYGPTGSFVGAEHLGFFSAATSTVAINEQPRGVLRLLQTMGGPQLQFTPGLTAEWLTEVPNATRALAAVDDGEHVWALVQQLRASVDYGVGSPVAPSGRRVLLELVMP